MFTFKTVIMQGLASSLLISQATAHFLLHAPETIGFDDDKEGIPPCGGFKVSFDKTSDWHVGGDAIALTSTHPQANWLFRATLDKTASGNWTDLSSVVSETGLGSYCEPSLSVPSEWAGKSGIIQIVQNAVDGSLFQCAAVNYVSGKASAPPSSCKNVTGLMASFTADPSLSATALAAIPTTATAGSGSDDDSSSTAASASTMGSMSAAASPSTSSASSSGAGKSFVIHTALTCWIGLGGLAIGVVAAGRLWL